MDSSSSGRRSAEVAVRQIAGEVRMGDVEDRPSWDHARRSDIVADPNDVACRRLKCRRFGAHTQQIASWRNMPKCLRRNFWDAGHPAADVFQ